MKLDEMKIRSSNAKGTQGFDRMSEFAVEEPNKEVVVESTGMMVKIGLCCAAMALALIVRLAGVDGTQEVVATGAQSEATATDAVGTLRYVDADLIAQAKWMAPVSANDIELLRDAQMVRFTATVSDVRSCMNGIVLMVETDERFGRYVRIQGEDGLETTLYGLDTTCVTAGQTVAAEDSIGTIAPGRSLYLTVSRNGAPQDPTEYVDLSIRS